MSRRRIRTVYILSNLFIGERVHVRMLKGKITRPRQAHNEGWNKFIPNKNLKATKKCNTYCTVQEYSPDTAKIIYLCKKKYWSTYMYRNINHRW